MKATYIYKSAFGDSLLTITGKSAARGRDSVHNLRWERMRYIDRIDELNKNVRNLRRANAVCRSHARKEGERMLAEITRLQEAYESLTEENKSLCSEIARLHDELADEVTFALHGWALANENAKHSAKVADRLHACRIDRRKWRDIAERCFAAAMKNALALADEHKRGA